MYAKSVLVIFQQVSALMAMLERLTLLMPVDAADAHLQRPESLSGMQMQMG